MVLARREGSPWGGEVEAKGWRKESGEWFLSCWEDKKKQHLRPEIWGNPGYDLKNWKDLEASITGINWGLESIAWQTGQAKDGS